MKSDLNNFFAGDSEMFRRFKFWYIEACVLTDDGGDRTPVFYTQHKLWYMITRTVADVVFMKVSLMRLRNF